MSKAIIIILVIFSIITILFIYCSLILASRADNYKELDQLHK